MVGGSDTDIATHFGPEVYGTGLTLLNITLAASCDRGENWSFNAISNIGAGEDRQWIDTYEDRAPPLGVGAPDFVLNYGSIAERKMLFHQVLTPLCVPPIAYTDNLNTPPDGADPHQEWIMFVQQKGGKWLLDK